MPLVLAIVPLDADPLVVAALPAGARISAAVNAEAALAVLTAQPVDLILAPGDLDLAGLVMLLKANKLATPLVVVGPADPAVAAKAIRLGALDYLTAPLEPRLLTAILDKLAPTVTEGPIAADLKTTALLAEARQFAASTATVLLRGESGTGKEVLARFIHQHSLRAARPFIAVNCAAIPENLLESELFGHEKGAFSGALNKRIGKFQQAHGGTLLLDEISEMDAGLQAKLLRAIQERVIDPIGADKPVPVDIRLVATTNRNLEDFVAQGKFREDLYFRLNVVALEIPPLRERPGDILPLARHFAEKYAEPDGAPALAPAAADKLRGCYWKGNVRELENTIHRAILLARPGAQALEEGHVQLSPMSLQMMSLAASVRQAGTTPAGPGIAGLAQAVAGAYGGQNTGAYVPRPLAEVERDTLQSTLAYARGNEDFAAHLLGISVVILREKLTRLGLINATG
jgi:DNA-binding NtrC family response regulator